MSSSYLTDSIRGSSQMERIETTVSKTKKFIPSSPFEPPSRKFYLSTGGFNQEKEFEKKAENSVLLYRESDIISKFLSKNFIDEKNKDQTASIDKDTLNELMRILQKYPKDRSQKELMSVYPFVKNITFLNQHMGDTNLADLPEESLRLICEQMQFKFHPKNDIVCYYGDPGKYFYIMLDGEVDVLIPTNKMNFLNKNPTMQHDKSPNLSAADRRASARSKFISKMSYNLSMMTSKKVELDSKLIENYREQADFWLNIMEQLGFKEMNEEVSEVLYEMIVKSHSHSPKKYSKISGVESQYKAMIKIIQKGLQQQFGRIPPARLKRIQFDIQEQLSMHVKVTTLVKGQCFGEQALLNRNNLRQATVRCNTDCYFGTLQMSSFNLTIAMIQKNIINNKVKLIRNSNAFKN